MLETQLIFVVRSPSSGSSRRGDERHRGSGDNLGAIARETRSRGSGGVWVAAVTTTVIVAVPSSPSTSRGLRGDRVGTW